jgi:hypothetical protein
MVNLIQVAYSNSKCSDIWEMFIKQNNKHTRIPLYMICDVQPEITGVFDYYIYSNSEPYYMSWSLALNKFNPEYFIYLQEDFILYNNVNEAKILEYLQFLKRNPQYSFVRLIRSGNLNVNHVESTLFSIESSNQNIFSMQPTIWRTSDYLKLINLVRSNVWYDEDSYRSVMDAWKMMGVYHYDGENKRGKNHYDTNVYPYIATALVKGKWNVSEYTQEMSGLISEYNINVNIRGIR